MNFFIEIQLWLEQQIQHNDVFAGLMGASIIMPLLYMARNLPRQFMGVMERQFTVNLTVSNDDETFEGIIQWLASTAYAKHTRRTKLSSSYVAGQDVWTLAPGYGRHFFWYKHRLLVVNRDISENQTFRIRETITITLMGRSQKFVREIVRDAEQTRHRPQNGFRALIWNDWWESVGLKPLRSLESVILPVGQMERILTDIQEFRDRREWYQRMGIPYRRGYLFSGAPGTGKSSIISAIASEFGVSVYLINLGMVENDNSLISAFTKVPPNCILVIEDVDAFGAGAKRSKEIPPPDMPLVVRGNGADPAPAQKGVSLSGLLNAIDGIVAPEGRILIMTTNYVDKLDPALIRPGRVDIQERFELFGRDEIRRMYNRFHGTLGDDTGDIRCGVNPISAADLQSILMTYSPREAVDMINQGKS